MSANGHSPVPRHVAIIMDGNGRWAKSRSLARVSGHRAGVQAVRETSTECARLGVQFLTLYAFSSENWKRPRLEVQTLMRLLKRFLVEERATMMENRIRLTSIGRIAELPADVARTLRESEALTANHSGMNLCLALSYGGRAELVDAMRKIAAGVKAGRLDPASIDEETIRAHLYDSRIPDPDLVIRTAGEKRLSNFLLWQASYAELYTTSACWPDFRKEHLEEALAFYRSRERKFGGLIPAKA